MSDQDNTIAFIRDKFSSMETNMNRGFDEVKDLLNDHAATDAELAVKMDDRVKRLEDHRLVSKGKIIAYSSVGGGAMALLGIAIEAWVYK